ncbi:MAG TPA: aminopeptidase [Longimicrobiales bacterium]
MRTQRPASVLAGVLTAAGLALALAACSPTYILRAGLAEAKILSRRRPIAAVVADPATPPPTRHKLQLVLAVRTYASRILALRTGESYTTYSWVDRDTLLMVLQAAPKLAFREYTWWFPIVGRVPYKGYFDFARARDDARALEKQGYDVWLRPSSAFSTLGYFNDPLLNTILRYDDVDLANTVVHELTHNTLYVPSQIAFNESLANFVGAHGAIDYFCSLGGEVSPECDLARRRWHDDLVFGRFLSELVARLEAVYARTDLPAATRLTMRDSVFQDARTRWAAQVEPTLTSDQYRGWGKRAALNNAALIARRIYFDRLDVFDSAYQRTGGELRTFVRLVKEAVKGQKDAYAAVEKLGGPVQAAGAAR